MRHCGFRIADCGLALLVTLVLASPALAQSVDVTASLDITGGLARVGAYVPVTLKVTNRTDKDIAEVFVTTGGPVDVCCEWRLAPGETDEKVLPVYYAGGDLAPAVEFRDADGNSVACAKATLPPVRPLPEDKALIAIQKGLPNTIYEVVPQPLWISAEDLGQALRCGVLDVVVVDRELRLPGGRAVRIDNSLSRPGNLKYALFPGGVDGPIQPAMYGLFDSRSRRAGDRQRLWLWLGLFVVAVVAGGVLVHRRGALFVAGCMALLAAGATTCIWLLAPANSATLQDARIFYVDPFPATAVAASSIPRLRAPAALEHVVHLQSRGAAHACYRPGQPGVTPLPWPVLAEAQDLFRQQFTLVCQAQERVESHARQVLLHILDTLDPPFGLSVEDVSVEALRTLADRPDCINAVRVEGLRGTDAGGRSQTVDAWAVEWQGSEDPNVAYAGRSLKWWDHERREGDGPFLLAWFHDPLPAGRKRGNEYLRLPALVVYSEAPKQD